MQVARAAQARAAAQREAQRQKDAADQGAHFVPYDDGCQKCRAPALLPVCLPAVLCVNTVNPGCAACCHDSGLVDTACPAHRLSARESLGRACCRGGAASKADGAADGKGGGRSGCSGGGRLVRYLRRRVHRPRRGVHSPFRHRRTTRPDDHLLALLCSLERWQAHWPGRFTLFSALLNTSCSGHLHVLLWLLTGSPDRVTYLEAVL